MSKLQISTFLVCSGIFLILFGNIYAAVGVIVGFAGIISGIVCISTPSVRRLLDRSRNKKDKDQQD